MFQQWNGVNAILYYAPFIFDGFGFSGSTTSLLATGVVGVVMFLATIPAVLYVDRFGRKVILITGGIGMAVSHFIVAAIIGSYSDNWPEHRAAGWVAVVFVWFYAINFGYSWVRSLGHYIRGVPIGNESQGSQYRWIIELAEQCEYSNPVPQLWC